MDHKISYKPTVIIHGGAGAITRANLPPDLYHQYHTSLLKYLEQCQALLDRHGSALDVACHAVSLMEDDPLFNCGRGSVFTTSGTIEMEASVMVASINDTGILPGSIKRGAAVSLVKQTRHPILLAKELLVSPDKDSGLGGTGTMHCHLSGGQVEDWGFGRGLEQKPKDWFWTKRRWEEHRRGLSYSNTEKSFLHFDEQVLPSQGTVGAVCVDAAGNIAVATSTGGLTNKLPGRIGDTPSIGAGFWAEAWSETSSSMIYQPLHPMQALPTIASLDRGLSDARSLLTQMYRVTICGIELDAEPRLRRPTAKRRVVAMSGTGNGDSFLRTNACRTAAARARFSAVPLSQAIDWVAGPDGELQRSASSRWGHSGEGQGGIIGIEVADDHVEVVFNFNCGGLWRAWYDNGKPKVMVFRSEYQD